MADATPLPENSSADAVVNSQPPSESDIKASQSDPSPVMAAAAPLPPPPSIQSYSTVPPSFRPAAPPAPVPGGATPLFSPLPQQQQQQQSLSFVANPAVQPPGVSSVPQPMNPAPAGGSVPQIMQPPYGVPGQLMRPYATMPNGYTAIPQHGAMPHHVFLNGFGERLEGFLLQFIRDY